MEKPKLEKQESIPVGSVLPAYQPYLLQPLDVSTGGEEGPQVKKLE